MAQEIDQPKPTFTLLDLEAKLTQTYDCLKLNRGVDNIKIDIDVARGIVHELLAVITKTKDNLGSIEMPIETAKAITDTIQTEKPEFSVCGVQLIENGTLVGTSLYSTVIKARKIKDVLNKRFAELRVDHVAKIVNYPVF